MTGKTYPATEAQRATGDWNPLWSTLEELDPDYLEAFLHFRSVPRNGPLDQKTKELIFIAINVPQPISGPRAHGGTWPTRWRQGPPGRKSSK